MGPNLGREKWSMTARDDVTAVNQYTKPKCAKKAKKTSEKTALIRATLLTDIDIKIVVVPCCDTAVLNVLICLPRVMYSPAN